MILNETNFDQYGNPHIGAVEVDTFKQAENLIIGMWENSKQFHAYRIERNKDGIQKWQLLNELEVVIYELKYTSL